MKYKKIELILVLLLFSGLTGLHAQSKLLVKNKSGTQTIFELNHIKKLSFPIDKIAISQNDGSINTYELNDIRYLSFSGFVDEIQPINNFESTNFALNPNPVIDQIQISYELTKPGNVFIEIIDLLGKVLYQQNVNSKNGSNQITISVKQLPAGLYMCHIQNDAKLEIVKFYKK